MKRALAVLACVVVMAGCSDRDIARAAVSTKGASLEDACSKYTSLATGASDSPDPCVAYWLRKIAEKNEK